MNGEEFKCGQTAQDTVTGFQGTVIGIAEWLHDPPAILIEGQAKDGKLGERSWFPKVRCKTIAHLGA